jgi:hypothetical protein
MKYTYILLENQPEMKGNIIVLELWKEQFTLRTNKSKSIGWTTRWMW